MRGEIRTRRWDEPEQTGDGWRLLVTRFRPRGVAKTDETWDEWWSRLAPSKELHAAYYGKAGEPIPFEEYVPRYLEEMERQGPWIEQLAARVRRGETLTLLCSSACVDPARCHRTLLKGLIEARLGPFS